MIEVKDLSKTYKVGTDIVKAVDNVSLKVEKGEFLSIVGHSGSGKTTFLSLIGGLTKPDSGTVSIEGTDIWSISDNKLSELRNLKINFIYQFSSLIPTLDVIENVLLPTAFSRDKDKKYCDYAMELIETVGIQDKIKSYPSQLSGGQQRRAAIARAFINRPSIILADEPTGDLDEETEIEIMNLFKEMNKNNGITFLIVTHSSELAKHTNKQYRMLNGKLNEA
ncbi:lipoprotein-releasing system ATP-binding protein LolD [bacterium BMS3Bbin05]|nr:lipoprotein-releasing system ATP-binding protein LolD [bacterium BMS3Bbin05]